ncbi:MAG TPA: DUF721 domain-containing protein [Bacteroidales bacterium]|jgi:predicted nucleic acid-binding Zn ribbon protein|nr:DUF721 domain-containing protein [Bacteroidota bacterium]HOP58410.1 DUF721 domain-containing protein [Bacteroidales bacterium]HPI68111.1 DUF721 domain-containing protein [Bacteroidales bacterium]HPR72379.1 DUF721 domain-containing protein [Bacteroidales bacterium]
MRRSKTISIAEAITDYIREMKLERKLDEIGLLNSWEETVGKAISVKTSRIYIKNKVLYVHLSSSVVRNELLMLRKAIVDKLNEKVGKKVITDLVLK